MIAVLLFPVIGRGFMCRGGAKASLVCGQRPRINDVEHTWFVSCQWTVSKKFASESGGENVVLQKQSLRKYVSFI
jgi:hypothetical protein